jgi:hypothetical protein
MGDLDERVQRGGRSEYRDLVYGAYGVVVEPTAAWPTW